MNRSIRLTAIFAITALTVLASVAPVSAVKIKGEGYYSRFQMGGSPEAGGVAIVDKVTSSSGRLNALLVGLLASEEYFIVGRSIGCGGTPSNANRVFRTLKMSNPLGDLEVENRAVTMKDVLVSSIWVGPTDGSQAPACAISFNFEKIGVATGDINGDVVLATFELTPAGSHAQIVVEKRPNSNARVSIVVNGLDGNDTYSVIGSKRPCSQPTSGPTNAYKITLENAQVSSYSVHDIHMNQGNINALRSVRVRNVSESKFVGCSPSFLTALLLP